MEVIQVVVEWPPKTWYVVAVVSKWCLDISFPGRRTVVWGRAWSGLVILVILEGFQLQWDLLLRFVDQRRGMQFCCSGRIPSTALAVGVDPSPSVYWGEVQGIHCQTYFWRPSTVKVLSGVCAVHCQPLYQSAFRHRQHTFLVCHESATCGSGYIFRIGSQGGLQWFFQILSPSGWGGRLVNRLWGLCGLSYLVFGLWGLLHLTISQGDTQLL